MYNLLETIRICAVLLKPFMPETSDKIFAQIGAGEDETSWESATSFGLLSKTAAVTKGEVIFPRIDLEKELKALAQQQ